jgi:hypothetical protein
MSLLIIILLLTIFAGLITFLIYSLLSYRKRNIIKFLILVCGVFIICDVVIAQSENITGNITTVFDTGFEPTFETNESLTPSPIILPKISRATTLIDTEVHDYYHDSEFVQSDEDWLYMSIIINNIINNSSINDSRNDIILSA